MRFVKTPPYLVDDPRCKLYIRSQGTEGNLKFFDASPSHNTVTRAGSLSVVNSPAKFAPSSMSFASNNYLVVGDSADWDRSAGQSYTLSMWVYCTNTTVYKVLFSFAVSTTDAVFRLQQDIDQTWTIYVPSGNVVSVLETLPANTWTHLAIICNGNTVSFYINGVQKGSSGTSSSAWSTATRVVIGANYNNANPFIGNIDEFTFWKDIAIPITTLYPQNRRFIV